MSAHQPPRVHLEVPDNHVFVLFGATGDLAKRKIIPGLFHLASAGLMPEQLPHHRRRRRTASAMTDDEFRALRARGGPRVRLQRSRGRRSGRSSSDRSPSPSPTPTTPARSRDAVANAEDEIGGDGATALPPRRAARRRARR